METGHSVNCAQMNFIHLELKTFFLAPQVFYGKINWNSPLENWLECGCRMNAIFGIRTGSSESSVDLSPMIIASESNCTSNTAALIVIVLEFFYDRLKCKLFILGLGPTVRHVNDFWRVLIWFFTYAYLTAHGLQWERSIHFHNCAFMCHVKNWDNALKHFFFTSSPPPSILGIFSEK